jgi:hypothetical protein
MYDVLPSKPGMHNKWPAGRMWPAEDFNLARDAQNSVHAAAFLHLNTL